MTNLARPLEVLIQEPTQITQVDAIRVHVYFEVDRLREKLRDNTADPQIVLTVRGQGYMFAKS